MPITSPWTQSYISKALVLSQQEVKTQAYLEKPEYINMWEARVNLLH